MPLFLILALLLGGAAHARPEPPLCRVTAEYDPVAWPSWAAPEDRFRRIIVRLRPGCPPGGEAHVRLSNTAGRRLPESGFYTLTPARPVLTVPARPPYAVTTPNWEVFWLARSGRPWLVPQTLTPRGGEGL